LDNCNKKGKVIVSHSARIEEENISSYQAEAFGILNAITMLQNHVFEVQQWVLYCNNQALVERVQAVQGNIQIPPKWKDWDIIESIRQKVLPNGEFKHVKGHQTPDSKIGQKPEAVLNNWVDDMANKAIESDNRMKTPEDIAHVVINNKRVFNRAHMISQCTKHISQPYHISKYGVVEFHHINWELYKKSFQIHKINVNP
jgi:hypothetical protein